MKGKIKFFNEDKGFGFIIGEDNNEYFFHISGISDSNTIPDKDDEVKFNIVEGDRGKKADNIQFIGEE